MGNRLNLWVRASAVSMASWATLLGVAVVIALPLATVTWLPFVDYPEHLGTIAALAGRNDPRFAPYFVVEYGRTQYLSLYLFGDWLTTLVSAETAGRWTAILSVCSLPLAVGFWLREHGRSPLLGIFVAPVATHVWVFWGFLNYAAGMSVAVVTAAFAARLAQRPSWLNATWLAISAILCFYTHAQLYAWMGVAALVQLVCILWVSPREPRMRAFLWSTAAALPSALFAAVWLGRSNVLTQGEAGARSGHAAQVAAEGPAAVFSPVAETVRGWLSHSFDVYRDGSAVSLAVAFFFAIGVLISLRGSLRSAGSFFHIPSLAPEAVVLCTFALYLFAPFSYRLIEPINHRFLPLAFALLPALGPRVTLERGVLALVASAGLGLSIWTSQLHAEHFAATDREMGDLDEALSHTEPGKRLLGLIYEAQSEVVPLPVYLHSHQYYQARQGGLACFSFVEFPKSPVQYRDGAAPPPFPPRFEWTPQRYDHSVWGRSFDYWLVRHAVDRDPPNVFRGAIDPPRLLYSGSRWTLYGTPPSESH